MKTKTDFAILAGLATWLLVYAISVYILQRVGTQINAMFVHALFLSYGVVFWLLSREQGRFSLSSRWGMPLLALQL
ncbi:MAG TPA: sensor histidine kinase, partial [Rheinheimera sp.]|nr:sensor histidine kinase [Rheinheimera sp.]